MMTEQVCCQQMVYSDMKLYIVADLCTSAGTNLQSV